MKTFAILLLLTALALPALAAAPIGTRTSQSLVSSAAVDAFSYRVSSLVSFQRTAQGLLVTTTPANLFSTTQPAGPENNAGFSESFTIPQSVIDAFF